MPAPSGRYTPPTPPRREVAAGLGQMAKVHREAFVALVAEGYDEIQAERITNDLFRPVMEAMTAKMLAHQGDRPHR